MITIPTEFTMAGALELLLIVFLIGSITAIVEIMFQYFMQPNMILYPWAVLLAKIASKGEMWRHLMRPFGRCRFCNGIWICMYTYIYILGLNPLILFAFAFNFAGVYLLGKYVFPFLDPAENVDKELKIKFEHANTPWQDMLKTYAIMGFSYSIIYGVIPFIV